jgi:dihydrolipoamide dehydrogenase
VADHAYDVVVIGAGPAGENAADYATQRGLDVAIVERGLVGGECSYWACMPSKALLRPAEALAAARRVPGAAPAVEGGVDVEATLDSRDAFSSHLDDQGQVDWLESAGIALHRGHGRLAGPRTVEVTHDGGGGVQTLTAHRAVVIAIGSVAAAPPVDGLDDIRWWDNRDVTQATQIPRRLLVLGGGVVGVEMAQAYASLGADEVTIVETQDRLLANEEPEVGDHLAAALRDAGITVRLDAMVTAVTRDGADGPVTATLADGSEIVADELLVATGRRVASDDLGLDTVDVAPSKGGFVAVDDHLRVPGHEWLYVVGDANGRSLLTHQGKYQARLVGDAVAGVEVDPAWADDKAVPRVVFTDPQVAAVGLTERGAVDAGIDVRTASHDLGATAGGALTGRGFEGPAKLVIDRGSNTLVGATFVGPRVGEMLHAATVAIVSGITVDRLWHAVPAYPTVSEVWLRLLEQLRSEDLAQG